MPRLALAVPHALEEPLATEALRHGHEVLARIGSGEELERALADLRPDVVIVAAAPSFLTAALLAGCDDLGIRVVGLTGVDADRRHAATLGLREVVDATAPWASVESLLRPVLTAVAQPQSRSERGRVIAVWGAAGAPGRTTAAITIAAEIAAAGYSVALCDADTHSGSIASMLGLLDEAPGFAAACRLAGTESLSTEEFERVGQRYWSSRGSFWVLTGIGRPSRWPELSAPRVAATIEAARAWVDFTVLDIGASLENDEEISSDLFAPRRNAATVTAIREADHVLAICAADPVGLSRFLRAHVDLIEVAGTPRVSVIANKVRASAIGMNPAAQVEQTLSRFGGIRPSVLVPDDRQALDIATLSGRTLLEVAPKSPARLAFARFVTERILPERPARAKRKVARRFRSVATNN